MNTYLRKDGNSARIAYIDVLRGMLMFLVVLGHSIGSIENPVNRFILSFHMPAFFIVSGYCFKNVSSGDSVGKTLIKKAKGLVWPYLTLSIIGVAVYWVFMAGTARDQSVSVLQSIIGIVLNDSHFGRIVTGGFWFVYDLIWITAVHILSWRLNNQLKLLFFTIVFLLIYNFNCMFYLYDELIRISVGYTFFLIGNLLKDNRANLIRIRQVGGEIYYAFCILSLLITLVISQTNTPVLMFKNNYGNSFLFIFSSLLGTFFLYELARLINHCRIIEYIGKNTLLVLQMHFIFIMVSHVLLHKLYPMINNYVFPFYLFHFIIATLACFAYIAIVNKWFRWLVKFPIQ